MIGLYVLHWGLVDLHISVSGADPSSGGIPTQVKSGGTQTRKGTGKTIAISGSGGTKGISGSGGS